jgi:hypothetical protein
MTDLKNDLEQILISEGTKAMMLKLAEESYRQGVNDTLQSAKEAAEKAFVLEIEKALAAEREKAEAEIINLKTVMIAAAEEIAAHWKAHCDAEGYGPINLMHRLEKGIPAQYGYTAGDFERLRAENESLRAAIRARGNTGIKWEVEP